VEIHCRLDFVTSYDEARCVPDDIVRCRTGDAARSEARGVVCSGDATLSVPMVSTCAMTKCFRSAKKYDILGVMPEIYICKAELIWAQILRWLLIVLTTGDHAFSRSSDRSQDSRSAIIIAAEPPPFCKQLVVLAVSFAE
jgi:hypothetical protein